MIPKNVIEEIYSFYDHFFDLEKIRNISCFIQVKLLSFVLYGRCSHVIAIAVTEILYLFLTTMEGDAHEKSAKHEDLIAGDKI